MFQRIGILSDTHLIEPGHWFEYAVRHAFSTCDIIIHAGDLIDPAILSALPVKTVLAVHGNSCGAASRCNLPESRDFMVGPYRIAVCHGHTCSKPIEDSLLIRFAEADCIIYGHTHRPGIESVGGTLLINPGAFKETGAYGSPATYVLLTVGDDGLNASLHEVPLSR